MHHVVLGGISLGQRCGCIKMSYCLQGKDSGFSAFLIALNFVIIHSISCFFVCFVPFAFYVLGSRFSIWICLLLDHSDINFMSFGNNFCVLHHYMAHLYWLPLAGQVTLANSARLHTFFFYFILSRLMLTSNRNIPVELNNEMYKF